MSDDDLPILPYSDDEDGESSGWSGSDTSRERARVQDASGETASLQEYLLGLARSRRRHGITWKEASIEMNRHHGTISGALSNLHSGGLLARLVEVRGKCKVYVHPLFVEDREVEPPSKNMNARKIVVLRRLARQAEERGLDALPLSKVRAVLNYGEKENGNGAR